MDQLHKQIASTDSPVLSPEAWPFSLKWLPEGTHLVGGNVRDALLGRHADYLDLDFVLASNVIGVAQAIAKQYQAGFVVLDAERQIARVVFDGATADFALQVGDTLEDDLRRRDFTVNAIAYNPFTEQLFDPVQGYADLQRHCIRMIAPENLEEDPLRLLRAYRQAAQLSFALDPATQAVIRQLGDRLQGIAAERVQSELSYLLSTAAGTPFLHKAWQDGLLTYWLPHATASGLERVNRIDEAATILSERFADFGPLLSEWVRDQHKTSGSIRSWLKVAKLACLVAYEVDVAEAELWRLKYSRNEVQAVLTVIQAMSGLTSEPATLSLRDQYYLFRSVGAVFPAVVLAAVSSGTAIDALTPLMQRFLCPQDPVAHPKPMVTGRDLMAALQMRSGPQVGQLLEAIQLAHAEGQIHTEDEAIAYARSLYISGDMS
ncbi:MAG: CCA tRNA nucleotidyltransferase [Synechococcales cyanobacterium T60_A2020_003]|nr:CCA tRNA nucleotidyltransferase [Synechococcales cyanobacterium T60_A2020_003]